MFFIQILFLAHNLLLCLLLLIFLCLTFEIRRSLHLKLLDSHSFSHFLFDAFLVFLFYTLLLGILWIISKLNHDFFGPHQELFLCFFHGHSFSIFPSFPLPVLYNFELTRLWLCVITVGTLGCEAKAI